MSKVPRQIIRVRNEGHTLFRKGRWKVMYTPAQSPSRVLCDLALFDMRRHPYEEIVALMNVDQAEDLAAVLQAYLDERRSPQLKRAKRRPAGRLQK